VQYDNFGATSTPTAPSGRHNWLVTLILALVCIFVPIIGHIILTIMIINDYLSSGEKVIWLIAVWAIPAVGPFLYLLVGQRRNRLFAMR